jgi:hypothetical protein
VTNGEKDHLWVISSFHCEDLTPLSGKGRDDRGTGDDSLSSASDGTGCGARRQGIAGNSGCTCTNRTKAVSFKASGAYARTAKGNSAAPAGNGEQNLVPSDPKPEEGRRARRFGKSRNDMYSVRSAPLLLVETGGVCLSRTQDYPFSAFISMRFTGSEKRLTLF